MIKTFGSELKQFYHSSLPSSEVEKKAITQFINAGVDNRVNGFLMAIPALLTSTIMALPNTGDKWASGILLCSQRDFSNGIHKIIGGFAEPLRSLHLITIIFSTAILGLLFPTTMYRAMDIPLTSDEKKFQSIQNKSSPFLTIQSEELEQINNTLKMLKEFVKDENIRNVLLSMQSSNENLQHNNEVLNNELKALQLEYSKVITSLAQVEKQLEALAKINTRVKDISVNDSKNLDEMGLLQKRIDKLNNVYKDVQNFAEHIAEGKVDSNNSNEQDIVSKAVNSYASSNFRSICRDFIKLKADIKLSKVNTDEMRVQYELKVKDLEERLSKIQGNQQLPSTLSPSVEANNPNATIVTTDSKKTDIVNTST